MNELDIIASIDDDHWADKMQNGGLFQLTVIKDKLYWLYIQNTDISRMSKEYRHEKCNIIINERKCYWYNDRRINVPKNLSLWCCEFEEGDLEC